MSQPFGLLIPGAPVRTDFAASDPSSSRFTLALSGITGTINFFNLRRKLRCAVGLTLSVLNR